MAQLSMFGEHSGRLEPGTRLHISVFGGSNIQRPPAARLAADWRAHGGQPYGRQTFITVFGGTDVQWPTLAQEYMALRDALRNGDLTLADWDRLSAQAIAGPPLITFTLFGRFEANALPNEDHELEDLALQRHFGQIPDEAVRMLMLAVGQRGTERLAAVRQAVAATTALAAPRGQAEART